MNQISIPNKYDDKNILEIPSIVEMNDDQRSYLIKLLSSIRSVIDTSSTLEIEESKILGEGDFFWPKDPQKPVMRSKFYSAENFQIRGTRLQISREDISQTWNKAGISVTPQNFPIGVFSMNLPEQFYNDYVLVHSEQENRPEHGIKDPIVFVFAHRTDKKFFMKLEARRDVANVADAFPKSFHALWFERK
ncbi:hypothetical protein [Massilia sp. HP4]|uniref:hypothetical protein n=1 Tax=Massilia sp. HP4 TaxID=2562316 RepID=UPI0010C0EAAC|nr:hypothetical protein [Massilia sp. HP4]